MLESTVLTRESPTIAQVPSPLTRAAVLGAGAWGTALAMALQHAGVATTLWARRTEHARQLGTTHRNDALPDVVLPADLRATPHLPTALDSAQLLIFAVPAAATRDLARQVADHVSPGGIVLSASKGFEPETGELMTEVLDDVLGDTVFTGVLSGPSFALDVARGDATSLTLAMSSLDPAHSRQRLARRHADALARVLARVHVRLESTPDVAGAQVGGALKNQIAIACGMATALGLGENARAAILCRGLDDMQRLTRALGGHPETLLGSCGVGDLFLTAASVQSRNTRLGMRLAGGDRSTDELAEGAQSVRTVSLLEARLGIRLALATAVRNVLDGVMRPAEALAGLLQPQACAIPRPMPASSPESSSGLPALMRPLRRPDRQLMPHSTAGERRHV